MQNEAVSRSLLDHYVHRSAASFNPVERIIYAFLYFFRTVPGSRVVVTPMYDKGQRISKSFWRNDQVNSKAGISCKS